MKGAFSTLCFTAALSAISYVPLIVAQMSRLENNNGRLPNVRIMYDVSSSVSPPPKTLSDVYKDIDDDAAHYYYETTADTSKGACNKKYDAHKFYSSCRTAHALNGVSLILKKKISEQTLLNMSAMLTPFRKDSVSELLDSIEPSFLESVIISLAYNSSDCTCFDPIKRITDYVEKYLPSLTGRYSEAQKPVKLGVELNENFLKCCGEQQKFDLLGSVDHVILRIELTPFTTMLSYGMFSEMMNELVPKYRTYVQKHNPQSTPYIHLAITNQERAISEKGYSRYQALVSTFVQAWIDQGGCGDNTYIVPSSSKNITGSGHYLREKVAPVIYAGQKTKFGQQANGMGNSEPQKIVQFLHSVFNTVLLVNPTLGNLQHVATTSGSTNSQISIMFSYTIGMDMSETIKIMKFLVEQPNVLNIGAIYLDHSHFSNANVKPLLVTLHGRNVTFGCYMGKLYDDLENDFETNVKTNLEVTVTKCRNLFNVASHVLLQYSLRIPSKDGLIRFLSSFQNLRNSFIQKRHPDKTFVPAFQFTSFDKGASLFSFKPDMLPHSSYCQPKFRLANEYYQTILSFANIHQWPQLMLEPLSANGNDFGFWRNVQTDEEIDRSVTRFPLLVRSNSAEQIGENLPETYACIQWTADAPKSGINFLENTKSGATFEAQLRQQQPQPSVTELQTMFVIALSKFSFVELTVVNAQILQQIPEVLSNALVQEFCKLSAATDTLVYIEASVKHSESLQRGVWNEMLQRSLSVHMRDWEDLPEHEVLKTFEQISDPNLKYGLTVQNCSDEMNQGLDRLKRVTKLGKVTYLVCNVKPVVPENFNQTWMEEYFGALLYTKVYMEQVLSGNGKGNVVEVMFRINLMSVHAPACLGKRHGYLLSFLNDMNQHSAKYNIRYFIVRAFEKDVTAAVSPCSNSWWNITDYSDLTNMSVFVDRESEYFGRPTRHVVRLPKVEEKVPPIGPGANESSTSNNWDLYITIIIFNVVALILLTLFSFWFQRRNSNKNRLLSQAEVQAFYNGLESSGSAMELVDSNYVDTTYMKFPRDYEMCVNDLGILEVVGRGEFGVVHRGMYEGKLEVAIKIPKLDCGKEQFKSALSELKILGYVGSHPNIVSFLGAHTKEISKGKLLIVTEFCGKGSLESYLRSLQQQQQQNVGSLLTFDITQLYGFSYEIASGMEYVAEKRIVHGDLATRNVLLTNDYTCKISDFGLSRRVYEQGLYVKRGNEALPWMWMAPESLKFMEFTSMSDVWSYGVTLWEIFSLGKVPCPGMHLSDDYIMDLDRGVRMGKAQFASDALHEKMLDCWSLSQEERPNFTDLKEYFAHLRGHCYQNTSLV